MTNRRTPRADGAGCSSVTCQHDVKHDSAGPNVSPFAVVVIVQQHLGRDVVRRAAHRLGPRVDKLVLAVTEIAYFHIRPGSGAVQKRVFQLYVPGPAMAPAKKLVHAIPLRPGGALLLRLLQT